MQAETRSAAPAQTSPQTVTRSQTVAAGAVAFVFGLFVLYGIGFAQPEAIHNAAHDTRHSFTFPCH